MGFFPAPGEAPVLPTLLKQAVPNMLFQLAQNSTGGGLFRCPSRRRRPWPASLWSFPCRRRTHHVEWACAMQRVGRCSDLETAGGVCRCRAGLVGSRRGSLRQWPGFLRGHAGRYAGGGWTGFSGYRRPRAPRHRRARHASSAAQAPAICTIKLGDKIATLIATAPPSHICLHMHGVTNRWSVGEGLLMPDHFRFLDLNFR
jgi:hypothetical protein